MIKTFCDKCGKELTPENRPHGGMNDRSNLGNAYDHLGARLTPKIQIEVCVSGSGDFCAHCIIDAVRDLDNRPRMAARE